MKFRKPTRDIRLEHGGNFVTECVRFVDSLPDEFEILGPGEVAVKWPEGLTRERLLFLADKIKAENVNAWESWPGQEAALRALAAIAPERKKRRMSAWQYGCGIPQLFSVDWRPESAETKWRKVAGPIEIDD